MAGLVVYVLVYQWIYVNYLNRLFGDADYEYHPPGLGYTILAWTLSLAPGTWMPLTLKRPSQLAYWILYLIVIIPSMFVPFYIGLNRPEEVAGLVLALFLGFLMAGSSYLLPLLPIKPNPISRRFFWGAMSFLSIGLMLWIVLVFRGNLKLVSFADVYGLRFGAQDITRGSSVNYALMLLSGAINPFLMGWGWYHKRATCIIAGVLGQMLVYSAWGTKASLTSVVFIFLIYLVLRSNRISFALKMVWGTVALLTIAALSYVWAGESSGAISNIAIYLIIVRIFSINALLTGQYYYFFQSHPLTYYSHIQGVKWLIPYPYPNPVGTLGNEVGVFYGGGWEYGATVHFWAADGIAALGLPGIIVISLVCMLVFWLLDSASRGRDARVAALITSYAGAWNLVNNGIFTTLLSGGLALLILILYVLPVDAGDSTLKKT
jgi:hypothetical protein